MTDADLDQILALRNPPKTNPIIVPPAKQLLLDHLIRRGAWVETRREPGEQFHAARTGIVTRRSWLTVAVLWASGKTTVVSVRTLTRIPQQIR